MKERKKEREREGRKKENEYPPPALFPIGLRDIDRSSAFSASGILIAGGRDKIKTGIGARAGAVVSVGCARIGQHKFKISSRHLLKHWSHCVVGE